MAAGDVCLGLAERDALRSQIQALRYALETIVSNGDTYGTPEPWDVARAALAKVSE